MRKLTFLLLLLFISTNVYAYKYVVEKEDGTVAIIDYYKASKKTLKQCLIDSNLYGLPIHDGEGFGIVPTDKQDRKYWTWSFVEEKVIVDEAKKQADIDENIAIEAEKDKVLQKLGISKNEWKDLNKKEVPV